MIKCGETINRKHIWKEDNKGNQLSYDGEMHMKKHSSNHDLRWKKITWEKKHQISSYKQNPSEKSSSKQGSAKQYTDFNERKRTEDQNA